MKTVLVTIAPGFEEIETITIVDILRRAGARVTLAATVTGALEGSRGIKVMPDELLDDIMEKEFDLICLPGGQPGTDNLKNDPRILKLLQKRQGKYIAAICAAPIVLQKAGVLNGRSMTCHPSVRSEFKDCQFVDDRVVVDEKMITSQSPGTAMEFALKLVEILFGSDRMKKVNNRVLARI